MHYDFEQAQMDNYYISVESLCIFFVKKQINNDLHPNIILFLCRMQKLVMIIAATIHFHIPDTLTTGLTGEK